MEKKTILEQVKTPKLRWRVTLNGLFKEILDCNPNCAIFKQPFLITDNILKELSARAIEINDPELNALMLRLGLYSVADPFSPDFDNHKASELIKEMYKKAGKE